MAPTSTPVARDDGLPRGVGRHRDGKLGDAGLQRGHAVDENVEAFVARHATAIDGLLPVRVGIRELDKVLLAVGEVHQRADLQVELRALLEERASAGVVVDRERGASFVEEGDGLRGVQRLGERRTSGEQHRQREGQRAPRHGETSASKSGAV